MAARLPPWPLAWAALALLHAWLAAGMPLHVVPFASHDDLLFVRHAGALLSGQWLGRYDHIMLAKGPGYGMFIAAAWAAGLPLLVAQALLYAAAAALVVQGLRPWLPGEAVALALFAFLLFNPALFGEAQLRIMREGLYVPLTLLLLAGLVWWLRWRGSGLARRAGLAAALGLLLGWYWITREEGLWVFPTLFAALAAFLALDLAGSPRSWLAPARSVALAALAGALAFGTVAGVQAMNGLRYGVFVSVEFREPGFVAAYGALARIRHADPRTYIVAPRDVREAAYAASPAARELEAFLEGPVPQVLIEAGCELHGIVPCDGEMRGSHFMWLLREAANAAGHHRDAPAASGFYARLAAEIDEACEAGRLSCLAPRRGFQPPFDPARLPVAWARFGDALAILARLGAMQPPLDAMSCRVDDCGQDRLVSLPLEAARSDLFTLHDHYLASFGFQRRSERGMAAHPFQLRAAVARAGAATLIAAYRLALPPLLLVALAAALAGAWLMLRRRQLEPLLLVAALAAALALSRAALLAWMDASAMPGVNTLYLSPAWPPLLLFALLAPLGLWRLLRR